MDLIETFLHLIDEHGISQRAVSQTLGYSSPNQLTRLIKKQVSDNLMADFGARLLSCAEKLSLSPDSRRPSATVCPTSAWVLTIYPPYHRFAALLQNPSMLPSAVTVSPISLVFPDSREKVTLKKFFRDASRLHITAYGGCHAGLLQSLQSLEQQCELSVDYYYQEGSSALQCVAMPESVWGMLYKPWFHPWLIRIRDSGGQHGLLNAGVMLVDAVYPAPGGDHQRSWILVSLSSGEALCIPLPDAYQNLSALILPSQETASTLPMKSRISDFGNYLDYLSYIRELEHNHRVFHIKRDIGLELIPAGIQQAALREGPMGGDVAGTPLEARLWEVQNDRYLNSLEKSQHQYPVFSYSALRDFIRTGRQSDHFWGFRSFLPHERLSILNDLYIRATTNHHFHLLFLKQEQCIVPDEIVWYDGRGVCFILPGTDYDLDGNHSEFLIEDKSFCQFFCELFRKRLCERWVYSELVSATMLKRLMDELQAETGFLPQHEA